MRKISCAIYVMLMAALVLSLSGCNSSSSNAGIGYGTNTTVNQVVVVSAPSLQVGQSYDIYRGGTLSNMDGAKYYVAETGGSANQATMNLGLAKKLTSYLVVKDTSGQVVFAYDPNGSGTKDGGTVNYTNGTLLRYNGTSTPVLSSNWVSFASITADTSNAYRIKLNGSTATLDGTSVTKYDYVWHANPQHADEYWTVGINGSTEYDEEDIINFTSGDRVYITPDVRYTISGLGFTTSQTATKDEDTEYVVYYDEDSEEVAAKIAKIVSSNGSAYSGPYVFASLPMSGGMGGTPGGQNGIPGGQNSGDQNGNMTPPDGEGMTPPNGTTPPDLPQQAGMNAADSNIAYESTMTHTAAEAYANPVLHINMPGTYILEGTWNGQIWIDANDWAEMLNDDDYDEQEDDNAKVTIILNGVTVSCDVAPALVFHGVYECGPDDEDEVAASNTWKTETFANNIKANAGARVVISDDTTNNFYGANVYRIMKIKVKSDSVTKVDGTDISQQKKMYKMDGAFYSFSSLAIGAGGSKANGVLNVTSTTFEGLDAEMHMMMDSGVVNVNAVDDAVNVNEDDVSVFTMTGGTFSVTSQVGDGIDSNGYVAILGGTLNATAGSQRINSAGEAGIDAELGTEVSSNATYNWTAYSGTNSGGGTGTDPNQNQNQNENTNTNNNQSNTNTTTEQAINIIMTETGDDAEEFDLALGTGAFNMNAEKAATGGTNSGKVSSSGNRFYLIDRINDFTYINN